MPEKTQMDGWVAAWYVNSAGSWELCPILGLIKHVDALLQV